MLTCLEDEDPQIATSTREKWLQVGAKFLSEEASKDKRIKDAVDFPEENDSKMHYPEKSILKL